MKLLHWTLIQNNIDFFELDFNVKFPLLRLLHILSDYNKSTIIRFWKQNSIIFHPLTYQNNTNTNKNKL